MKINSSILGTHEPHTCKCSLQAYKHWNTYKHGYTNMAVSDRLHSHALFNVFILHHQSLHLATLLLSQYDTPPPPNVAAPISAKNGLDPLQLARTGFSYHQLMQYNLHLWWPSPATCTCGVFHMPTGSFTGVHKHMYI